MIKSRFSLTGKIDRHVVYSIPRSNFDEENEAETRFLSSVEMKIIRESTLTEKEKKLNQRRGQRLENSTNFLVFQWFFYFSPEKRIVADWFPVFSARRDDSFHSKTFLTDLSFSIDVAANDFSESARRQFSLRDKKNFLSEKRSTTFHKNIGRSTEAFRENGSPTKRRGKQRYRRPNRGIIIQMAMANAKYEFLFRWFLSFAADSILLVFIFRNKVFHSFLEHSIPLNFYF